MPRTCTICTHKQHGEIDEALVSGESLRSIALRFDTSHMAVRRHKEHLSGKLVKAAERAEERHADSLVDRLDDLLVRAKALLDEVFPEKRHHGQVVKPRDVAAAIREMRETLLLMGRMTGQLKGDGATVNVGIGVLSSPEWGRVAAAVTGGIGGGTLANLCYGQLQPSYLPLSHFVPFPTDPHRGVLVIQVRPELARIPLWERTQGVVVRISDQNRPPDLQRLRALLALGERRTSPIRRLADHDISLALAANAEDRTYVVVGAMIQRSLAQDQWTDAERQDLGSAVSISLQEGSDSHDANLVLIQHDDNPYTYVALKSEGIAIITLAWKRDPFPITWALAGLIAGVRILLSEPFQRAYQPIAPMEVTLGIVNWPEHGLDIKDPEMGDLYPLGRSRPIGSMRSRQISRKYSLAPTSVPWAVLGPFTSYMLRAAGYTGHDRFLDEPPASHLMHRVMNNIGLSLG